MNTQEQLIAVLDRIATGLDRISDHLDKSQAPARSKNGQKRHYQDRPLTETQKLKQS